MDKVWFLTRIGVIDFRRFKNKKKLLLSLKELMGFTNPLAQKMHSCQGNKRWSTHAFVYHPAITLQEALSWLVWSIPLPTGASSATSHPFPAVLYGTHQLWHFPYLILSKGISSD